MIKTIRVDIPYSENKSMEEVLTEELGKVGLKISDIELKGIVGRDSYGVTSHFGNWCYVPAKDIPELHKTGLLLDLPQVILEKSDLEGIAVGDKVTYSFNNSLLMESSGHGKVVEIKSDDKMTMITVTKGKSKVKGYRFYTGDCVKIEKV